MFEHLCVIHRSWVSFEWVIYNCSRTIYFGRTGLDRTSCPACWMFWSGGSPLDLHHFLGVARGYRCWGLSRWASLRSVPPECRHLSIFYPLSVHLCVCLHSSLNAGFVWIEQSRVVLSSMQSNPRQHWANLKMWALPSQSYLDGPHLDLVDKLCWLQQASWLALVV